MGGVLGGLKGSMGGVLGLLMYLSSGVYNSAQP